MNLDFSDNPYWGSFSRPLFLFTALLAAPAAFAYGVVEENGTGHPSSISELLIGLMTLLGIFLAPLALNWLARAAWKARAKTEPPFDILSVSAIYAAVLLGLMAIFVIPAFKTLFDSFGADLPWLTLLLINGRYLLLTPAFALPVMLYILRRAPRRETYFGVILASEAIFLVMCLISLYSPIFVFGEAV